MSGHFSKTGASHRSCVATIAGLRV
jgi:hypothetical protein